MRSEAELAEIVEQLTEHQDSEDKQFECAASVPDMLINPVDRARRFYNENGTWFIIFGLTCCSSTWFSVGVKSHSLRMAASIEVVTKVFQGLQSNYRCFALFVPSQKDGAGSTTDSFRSLPLS